MSCPPIPKMISCGQRVHRPDDDQPFNWNTKMNEGSSCSNSGEGELMGASLGRAVSRGAQETSALVAAGTCPHGVAHQGYDALSACCQGRADTLGLVQGTACETQDRAPSFSKLSTLVREVWVSATLTSWNPYVEAA